MAKKVKAGEAYIRMSLDSKIQQGLNKASKRMKNFGRSVAVAGAGIAAIGGGLIAPIIAAAKNFADFGDNLDKMAGRTGVAVESLSELKFAAEQSGSSINDVERAIRGMQRGVFDAKRGIGEMKDAVEELGLSYEDFEGLSTEEQFLLIADRLSDVTDSSIQAGIAMKAFGRVGTSLIPMLGNIKTLREEAKALGITMSTEDATAAAELTDAMNRLDKVFLAIRVAVGSAVGPLLTDLADTFTSLLSEVIKFVKANKELVVTILTVGSAIAGIGGALVAIGASISLLGFAFGGLATAVGILGSIASAVVAIISPVGLLIAALASLAYSFVKYTETGRQALEWLGDKFGRLYKYVANVVKFIGKAFAAGGIDLAVKVMWAGIKIQFYKGAQFIYKIWNIIYSSSLMVWNEITTNIQLSLQMVAQLALNAANAVSRVFWDAAGSIVDAFAEVAQGIVAGLSLAGLIGDSEYAKMSAGIERLRSAAENFAKNQKTQADDIYGGYIEESKKKQDELRKAYEEGNKKIVDTFGEIGNTFKEDLEKAKEEFNMIAETINKVPDELSKSAEELKKNIKDTKQNSEMVGSTSASGSFNAAAVRGLSIAGIDLVAKYTQQTAKNTEKIANSDGLSFS